MSDLTWLLFLVIAVSTGSFFFFSKRRVDFLTIAFIGSAFYFSPLLFGTVLQSSPDLTSKIQPEVYLIATVYLLALVVAALVSARLIPDSEPVTHRVRSLSGWYLLLAALGLTAAVVSTKGAIFNADKVVALQHIGYLYVLFEMAASLACISAVIERRWWILVASAVLLTVDLLIGIRASVVLTALSIPPVLLLREGRLRLFTKAPTYGVAALVLVLAMLSVHTARFIIFDQLAVAENTQVTTARKPLRTDVFQYDQEASAGHNAIQKLAMMFEQSEPFVIQATLVGVVQTDLSCSPINILKSLYLLAPPGLARILPNTFPPTFFDEYQPILYPDMHYGGLGGNIWAEMLCRFGYVGVAIFGVLMIASLVGLYRLLRTVSPAMQAPIAFGAVIIAFYINRNDLHFTLVMLRQIAFVFAGAWLLSWARERVQRLTTSPRRSSGY